MAAIWQDMTVLAVVLGASVYLLRRFVQAVRSKGIPVCGGCPRCSTRPARKLIQIENGQNPHRGRGAVK